MLLCGVVVIVVACSLFGFCMAGELASRERNLRQFKNFILFLQNEITYKLTPVSTAVNRYCKEKSGSEDEENLIIKVLQANSAGLENSAEQDNRAEDVGYAEVLENADFAGLFHAQQERITFSDGDLRVVDDFFEQLGQSDVNGQKSLFEVTLARLEECITDAKAKSEQKGKMYKLLGLGTGIVVALLFI